MLRCTALSVAAMLAAMLRAGRPGKTVDVANAPGILFLDQRLHDAATRNLFNGRKLADEQLKLISGRQYCPHDVLL